MIDSIAWTRNMRAITTSNVDAMSEADTERSKPAALPTAAVPRTTLWAALGNALASWWGPGPSPASSRVESSTDLAYDRTDMAATRTLMAADRTLMAWVRTSLSLSSFGFTIYKVLQGFAQSGVRLPGNETPRSAGIFLTALGTLAMVMGAIEYVQALRDLRKHLDVSLARPAFVMAVLMSVTGLFLSFSILAKVL